MQTQMQTQMKNIVTLTMNPSLDISTSVDTVVPEHKLRCDTPSYEPGGGGINVARAIHKLGGAATACYLAGGPTGQMLTQLLAEEGVVQRPLQSRQYTRESFAVYEKTSGQQYRFSMPGAQIDDVECAQVIDLLSSFSPAPDYLVISLVPAARTGSSSSGSFPPGVTDAFCADLAALARRVGARLVVDTSGPSMQAALTQGVFLIKPNFRELGLLVGRQIKGDLDLRREAEAIVDNGQSEAVLVSLGAAGAALVTKAGYTQFRSPTVPIQSKVGAGDSMVGGLVLALARGYTLTEAARFGVATGAAAVMTPGSELCRSEDAERLYAQMQKNTQ